MSKNMFDSLRTNGYVLRRTNYGEADRILSIITPEGKISAIAKGVRREKSKLAGGIEMFSLVDINLHRGKSDLWTVTGAKMLEHYGNIVKDFARMEMAAKILKKISVASEGTDNVDLFDMTKQCLKGLNDGAGTNLVDAWFLLNLKKAMGEEINLYRDTSGMKLVSNKKYDWNNIELGFEENADGRYGADEIKMLRLMTSGKLDLIRKVRVDSDTLVRVYDFVKVVV